MTSDEISPEQPEATEAEVAADASSISRRGLLKNATAVTGIALGGMALGGAGGYVAGTKHRAVAQPAKPVEDIIRHTYTPHGAHQPGIMTQQPAVTDYLAFTLDDPTTLPKLIELMKLWSADISALMSGKPTTHGYLDEFAQDGVSLTITVGFGHKIFTYPGLKEQRPEGFVAIPEFEHEELKERWSGGDLLLIIASDDPMSAQYAADVLVRDAIPYATLAWVQHGSWRNTDSEGDAITGRSLLGHKIGTANPTLAELEAAVWPEGPRWFVGGTTVAIRRIQCQTDAWSELSKDARDKAIGRKVSTGAPLTGMAEKDVPDFDAKDLTGNLVIPANAHIRVARQASQPGRGILRRPVNYRFEERTPEGTVQTVGLIHVSYQADIGTQLTPILRALDARDAMSSYTTTIGSATFCIPPGFATDSYLGKTLFER